jgi:hypothetical protein
LLLGGCATSEPVQQPDDGASLTTADTVSTAEPGSPAATAADTVITPALQQAAQAVEDPARAGRFDDGKMWTFEYPPIDYFAETYDFRPDSVWFAAARLGALRIPGCTASFVSPYGLIMTNHHCARGAITQVSRSGERLLDEGFYASSLSEERPVDGFYADQLVAIEDVTDEVYAATQGAQTDAERVQAREDAIAQIQERIQGDADEDVRVQVVPLYNGGRYSAYTYRRYDDVRLVVAPELQLGMFGGDADNFTYPRYSLDMTFFRAYGADGEPLATPEHFGWSETGVEEGDAVFVIGNPGGTYRLETVAQLEFRRDVREPAVLRFLSHRITQMEEYLESDPPSDVVDAARNTLSRLRNGKKLYQGRVEALRDSIVMARRADAQAQLRDAIQADAELRAEYGGVIAQMADLQRQKRELADAFRAFFLITNPNYASATMRRALVAHDLLSQRAAGADASALRADLRAIENQPRGVNWRLLAARLDEFQRYFGDDDPITQAILDGRTPEEAAQHIIARSVLKTAESTEAVLADGALSRDDPALEMVAAFKERYDAYQRAWAGLTARQDELASTLGRARFAVYGTDVPPDATFTLRLADGVVQGYPYNGTMAPPYTTYYGLYDHYYSYGPGTEWDLPEQWLTIPDAFDLSTPLNFVSTNDITGGNSGSPVINRDHEVVGLIFDGNIESLSGDYIYLPDQARSVSVDARGILEALDDMYDADRLVQELTGTAFVPTEAEADAGATMRR